MPGPYNRDKNVDEKNPFPIRPKTTDEPAPAYVRDNNVDNANQFPIEVIKAD